MLISNVGRGRPPLLVDLQRNLPFHAAQTASKRLPLRDESSLNSSYAFWGSSRVSRGMVRTSSSSKMVRRSPELMRAHGTSDTAKVRPLWLDGMKVYTSRNRSDMSCGRDAVNEERRWISSRDRHEKKCLCACVPWTTMTRRWTRATAMEP